LTLPQRTNPYRRVAAPPRLPTLLLLLACLAPAPASADDATEAKLRFDRGLQHISRGKVRMALDEFFISNRLSANPSTAYNIAACLESLKRHDEAFSAYSEFLTHELSKEQRQAATEALARVLPKVARLAVESSPPGAAIFLDRENLGQYGATPRTLATAPGAHEVILKLPGYHPFGEQVKLVRGQETRVEAVLRPLTGRVRVTTKPPGAEVTVQGIEDAPEVTTPATVDVPIGTSSIVLALDGYERKTVAARVRAGQEVALEVELERLPPPQGRIRVVTNVASALVRVDGDEAGFTPLIREVAAGKHEIVVEKTDYLPWVGEVPVHALRPTAVAVRLRPLTEGEGLRTFRWVLLVGGAVAGLLGGGAGWMAFDAADQYDQDPTRAHYDSVGRWNMAADVLGGVTLAGLAGAVTLWLTEASDEERRSTARISRPKGMLADTERAAEEPAEEEPAEEEPAEEAPPEETPAGSGPEGVEAAPEDGP